MKLKYILIEIGDIPTPIMFPDHVRHADMAQMIGKKVISAGFVSGDDLCPFGESISLRVKHNDIGTKAFQIINES